MFLSSRRSELLVDVVNQDQRIVDVDEERFQKFCRKIFDDHRMYVNVMENLGEGLTGKLPKSQEMMSERVHITVGG